MVHTRYGKDGPGEEHGNEKLQNVGRNGGREDNLLSNAFVYLRAEREAWRFGLSIIGANHRIIELAFLNASAVIEFDHILSQNWDIKAVLTGRSFHSFV